MKKGRRILILTAVMLCVLLLAGLAACSQMDNTLAAMPSTAPQTTAYIARDGGVYGYSEELQMTADAAGNSAADVDIAPSPNSLGELPGGLPAEGRKLIRTGDVTLESLDFDKSLSDLEALVASMEGYIESSSIEGRQSGTIPYDAVSNRYAYYTIRVPSQSFDRFINDAGNIGNLLRKSSSGQDVSEEYFDTEARLESLRTMQERLLELLDKSTEMSDIVALEQALSENMYEIERLTGTLRKWDSLVNYSTVYLSIQEVREYETPEPVTLGERIATGFTNSLKALKNFGEGALVFVVGNLPVLIALGLLALAIVLIVRVSIRRSAKRRADNFKSVPPVYPQAPETKDEQKDESQEK